DEGSNPTLSTNGAATGQPSIKQPFITSDREQMRVTHPDPAIHAQISPNQLQIHGSELHFHVCRWYPWPFQNPIRKSAPTLSISKYRAAPSSTIQMEYTPHQRLDPKPSKSAI
ncbi:hypothetical protein ACLOJK_014541, partial [Asimina triloba]